MKATLKRTLALLLASASLFAMAACSKSGAPSVSSNPSAQTGQPSNQSSGEKIVWRVGHTNAEDHYWNVYMEKFGELVAEKSGGRIEVQVYPNSQLGDDAAMGEMIRNGNLDMMVTAACIPGKWYRPMAMMEMAGLFQDMDHVERFVYGDENSVQVMKDGCAEAGILLWDNWMRTGFEFMTTKPVSQLSDFNGLKVRVTPDEVWVKHMEGTYGLSSSPIAFSEVFTSLQQGVCEGVLNPISSMYTMRFHEVCDNLVIAGSNYDFAPILVSPKSWDALDKELQDIMWECELEIREEVKEYIKTEAQTYMDLMKAENPDLVITYLDKDEVSASAKKIHQEVVDLVGGQELYDAIQACAE